MIIDREIEARFYREWERRESGANNRLPATHAQWTVFDAGNDSTSSAICRITSRI